LLPPTPADPGWYALYANHSDGEVQRLPVLSWRGSTSISYEGSAVIMAWDDGGLPAPVDARVYAEDRFDLHLLGFFHPERFPEGGWIATEIERLCAKHREAA
jgi:hypothetical protein